MKTKVFLKIVLALALVAALSFVIPTSASADFSAKSTPKPVPQQVSACYKAKLARTALNQSLIDGDTVLAAASAIESILPAIKSSFPSGTTSASGVPYEDLATRNSIRQILTVNSSTYEKLMTYVNALPTSLKILSNSTSKALKNSTVGKVNPGDRLDSLAAYNAFVSTFGTFGVDDAGIAITTRNIHEITDSLINANVKAFEKTFPASAVNSYASASLGAAKNMSSFQFADEAKYILTQGDFTTFGKTWPLIWAQMDYFASEAQAIASLTQQLELSVNSALLKLPKC